MKNQYFGDINDYRKYGLLRILCKRFTIGVGWMLTPNDDSSDGKFVDYLTKPNKWRHYAPSLFDALEYQVLAGYRHVDIAEEQGLIREALYFTRPLTDNLEERQAYMNDMMLDFAHCDLIFLDPDNGLEVASVPKGKKNSSKYIYWDEIKSIFESGKSVLFYQHFQRQQRDEFIDTVTTHMNRELGTHEITAFRTGNVVFFFLPQKGVDITPLRDQLGEQWQIQFQMSIHTNR